MTTTPTAGPLGTWFAGDHARLEVLLDRAVSSPAAFDAAAFAEFRAGLLRHIALEEKFLLPRIRKARGGEPLPEARRLRVDHGAIASLLVPTPGAAIVAEIRSILAGHNALEEGPEGLYAAADRLLAAEAAALLERIRSYPPVKVAPHNDGPTVCRTAEEALRRSALQAEGTPRRPAGGAKEQESEDP
ncbi:MAG TPA: hemerythrin domain-containing protein [Anaeromyxobacteraceae bacterium]|nr:hemerythrin domain-containing protein [Anaeromyxobacteraceae bacterium]